jgi:hypothetical protein
MYENGKMRPAETTPGMEERGELWQSEFNDDIL